MKQSIGYTLSLNIAIIFIAIIFGIIFMGLSYYKAYKVGNTITSSIEKYEGYNKLAETEITSKLTNLGYNMTSINCRGVSGCTLVNKNTTGTSYANGEHGYCVYECPDENDYMHYKITTNMLLNIPYINSILNYPVENNTVKMYTFKGGTSTNNTEQPVQEQYGLFSSDGTLVASWDDLVNKYGLDIEKDYDGSYNLGTMRTALLRNTELSSGIVLVIPNSVTRIGNWALANLSSLISITIPNSVTSIGNHSFYNCSSLTTITIPESVTSIGQLAFYGCSSLTSITIPNSVTTIEDGTFWRCNGLTSVTIPNSVTSIKGSAFNNCSSLTNITIPSSVKRIESWAFQYCDNLVSVDFKEKSGWDPGPYPIIPSSDLENLSTAAEYLREEYTQYVWTRN